MSSGTPQGVVSQCGIGIDIGGTGTKGGIVDLATGQLVGERFRIPTRHVGIVFPAIIKNGVALSAANVDKSWINTNVDALMTETLGREVEALNDADGAGLAEAHYGAGKGKEGLVMVITLGTGIGSAMILNGQLVPNAELGHLEIDGFDAETKASAAAREREQLPWKKWAKKRLQRYFSHVEFLFSPSLFVIGGGVSKNSEKFLPYLELRTPVEIAALRNNAGIVGAALWAQQCRDAQAAKPVIDPVK
ncbi:polyphosphate--glucose phosphotransferase [Kocuria sp. KRD140]|uniref:polyphosphate--glucose phosphotransferase n=1 Tax=Kocuria sp. KRD140 TaxID=2729723 RepID=UPI0019D0E87C|nr:ROK family protein [Kocuria sp. KRD140]